MKKWLLALAIMSFGFSAHSMTLAQSVNKKSKNLIYGNLGFNAGGMVFGGDYEMRFKPSFNIGGSAKILTADDAAGGYESKVIGAFIRSHFYKRSLDFYVSPGVAILMVDMVVKDTTGIGPTLAFGVNYQLNKTIGLGIEYFSAYGWLIDKLAQGKVVDIATANLKFAF